jgi:uncharacterized membrane protein AbrB (regulator of aidB expression)
MLAAQVAQVVAVHLLVLARLAAPSVAATEVVAALLLDFSQAVVVVVLVVILVVAVVVHQILKLLDQADQEAAVVAAAATTAAQVAEVVQLAYMVKEPVAQVVVVQMMDVLDPVATIFTTELVAPEAVMAAQELYV